MKSLALCLVFVLSFLPIAGHAQTAWQNLGPFGGQVQGVVADYQVPNRLVAGTAVGEFYESLDGGQTWTFLSTLVGSFGTETVRAMAIDSANGDRLFASTQRTIYFSTDGGAVWHASSNEVDEVVDIQISPLNGTQLYAVSDYQRPNPLETSGLFRSLNGGLSWTTLFASDQDSITAFAFNPQDPQNDLYLGVWNGTQTIIQRSLDGGAGWIQKLTLPRGNGWKVQRLFVANNPQSTVWALLENSDSTKIYRSTNSGATWDVPFAAAHSLPINVVTGYPYDCSWLGSALTPSEYAVATPVGLLRSTNAGVSWSFLTDLGGNTYDFSFLIRAPENTDTFYGSRPSVGGLTKVKIGSNGAVSLTSINYGLMANRIRKVLFTNGQTFMVNNVNNALLISDNGGADFETPTGAQSAVAATVSQFSGNDYLIDQAGVFHVSTDGSHFSVSADLKTVSGFDTLQSALALSYYDFNAGIPSTVFVASLGRATGGAMIRSTDDGASWQTVRTFPSTPPVSLAAFYDESRASLSLFGATPTDLWFSPSNGTSWNNLYSAPPGYTFQRVSANHSRLLIQAVSATDWRLIYGRVNAAGQWALSDITASLQPWIQQFGYAVIQSVYVGEDGNYLVVQHFGSSMSTRVYKTSFSDAVRWAEVTESPVERFDFSSIFNIYEWRSSSFTLYASGTNGVWKLNQTAVVTQDTVAAAGATSIAPPDTTEITVNYRNDGTAYAPIDSFRIIGDPEHNFEFADNAEERADGYFTDTDLFLDIKTATPFPVYFVPKNLGPKTATLEAFLRGKKSDGINDSIIVLQTRLTGMPMSSRIATGLKGDTLDFQGVFLNSTKTKVFTITNVGNDVLYIYDVYIAGSSGKFAIDNINSTDSTQFAVAPQGAIAVSVSYTTSEMDTTIDSLVIESSAYNASGPDSPRRITLAGIGSVIYVDVTSVTARLNQPVTLDAYVPAVKTSEVTGFIKYKPLGSETSEFKQKALTPDFSGNPNVAHFTATIPAEDVTSEGIQFYAEVSSGTTTMNFPDGGVDDPYALPVTIQSPGLNSSGIVNLPGGTSSKAYRMVSFPLSLTDKTPQGAFRASGLGEIGDKGDWQLYRYDVDEDDFISADDDDFFFGTIDAGQSYLVISRKAKVLNSGSGRTVTPDEATIPIHPGWNMIANPYTFPIAWNVVAYYNTKIDFEDIVVLDNGSFDYLADPYSLLLEPWKGYFFYSNDDSGSYDLYYPPLNSTALGKPVLPDRRLNASGLTPGEYLVALQWKEADREAFRSQMVGEIKDALDGLDRYDKPSLPVLDKNAIQLRFTSGPPLYSDFRPISSEGSYWDFELSTGGGGGSVTLKSGDATNLPSGFQVVLVDRDKNQVVAWPAGAEENIQVPRNGSRFFRLLVGTSSFIETNQSGATPTSFSLSPNFPNPFNPGTAIRYGLPKAAEVTLAIYNTLGQKVRTLVAGRQTTGSYTVAWDGRNDAGRLVGSGVYVYRLQAAVPGGRSFSRSRKMMLIK